MRRRELEELRMCARTAIELGHDGLQVWVPQGWKAPKGFPKRELLCCPSAGGRTYRVDARKLHDYLDKVLSS
jgi:hypothetical protein